MILDRVKHVLALLVCICLFVFPAMGAPKPALISSVNFGYGNAMPMERWAPIHITITSSGGAFSGRILVKYRQDISQSQVIDVPASVAPGGSVPVEVVLNLPGDPGEIDITLLDSRNRFVDEVKYGIQASGVSKSVLPLPFDCDDGLIACVGRISAAGPVTSRWLGSSQEWYYSGTQPEPVKDVETFRSSRSGRIRAVAISPGVLSPTWAAFDSLEALIVRTEEVTLSVNEDSRSAVQQWVQSGGRLILQVDQLGEAWRSWLPPDIAGGITFGDTLRLSQPSDVKAALLRPVLVDAMPKLDNTRSAEQLMQGGQLAPNKPPALVKPQELGEKLAPASDVSGRTIEISPSLARRGWKLQWTSDGKSLIAHGPVGFGYVSIVGCDPAFAAATPNVEATYRLWLDVLRPPLVDYLSCPDTAANSRRVMWGYSQVSGANEFQRRAIVSTLNLIADEPSRIFSPLAIIISVLVCILILALGIGPFDAVVLKLKSKRQHSWLTALAWIGILTILAMFAPRILRGNLDTLVLRDRVIDEIVDGPVWTSGAFGYFASSPGSHAFTFPSPGAFVRGASAIQSYSRSQETIPAIFSAQGQSIVNVGHIAFTRPDTLEQGQWTFRTMIDESPGVVSDYVGASIEITRAGALVDLTLPKSDASSKPELRTATLRIGNRSWPLLMQNSPETPGHVHLGAAAADLRGGPSETDWLTTWGAPPVNGAVYYYPGMPQPQPNANDALDLPGAQRRRLAIESYINGGGYALVTCTFADKTSDIHSDELGARYNSLRTYRILIPLPAQAPSIEGASQ